MWVRHWVTATETDKIKHMSVRPLDSLNGELAASKPADFPGWVKTVT